MTDSRPLAPPALYGRLVQLFAPGDCGASIAGDLLEEFSQRAAAAGISPARRWYRRQAVQTAGVLFLNQFRDAPLNLAGRIAAALAALWLLNSLSQRAVTTALVLHSHEIYAVVGASNFWFVYDTLLMSSIVPFTVGWTGARLRRGNEMAFGIAAGAIVMAVNFPWVWRIVSFIVTHGFAPKWQFSLAELVIPPITLVLGALVASVPGRQPIGQSDF